MASRDRVTVELGEQDRRLLREIRDALQKPTKVELPNAQGSLFDQYFGPKEATYPRDEGDVIVLGPELFVYKDERVMCWKGQEYYKPCGEFVRDLEDGGKSHCVKIVGHARPREHEDMSGHISLGFVHGSD